MRDDVLPQIAFTFSDYREIKGVKAPFAVQQTAPNGITYTYRFEKVGPVAEAEDSRFQPR